jgi:hypothetical protein
MHFGPGYVGLEYGRLPEKEEGKSGSLLYNPCISPAMHFPGFLRVTLPVFPNPISGYYCKASVMSAAIRACRHIVSLAEMLVYEFGHLEHRDLALSLKNRL